jgi:hypothetical protein
MTNGTGGVGTPGFGASNLAAVARDDELLDLLGARGAAPDDDQVAAMLAALVRDVDDGLADLLADDAENRRPALASVAGSGAARAHGLRLGAAVTVVALGLSVSGVAAAVTGDPLAPYKGIVSAVTGDPGPSPNAARIAHLNAGLRGTRAKIAHGDLAGAQADLDRLKERLAGVSDLTAGERATIEARIAAIEKALAKANEAGAREPKIKDPKSSKRRNDTVPGAQQRDGTNDRPDQDAQGEGGGDQQGSGGEQSADEPTSPGKSTDQVVPEDQGRSSGAGTATAPGVGEDEQSPFAGTAPESGDESPGDQGGQSADKQQAR